VAKNPLREREQMAKLKGRIQAARLIDVEGLTDEDVRILKEFADFLR